MITYRETITKAADRERYIQKNHNENGDDNLWDAYHDLNLYTWHAFPQYPDWGRWLVDILDSKGVRHNECQFISYDNGGGIWHRESEETGTTIYIEDAEYWMYSPEPPRKER